MLLLGVELQDILRVAIGIALGLLTCYRRELSCNRGYYHHPSDDNDHDDPPVVMDAQSSQHCDSLSGRERNGCAAENSISCISSRRGLIRRRNSSSALPNMIASVHHDDDVDDNDNHRRGPHSTTAASSCNIHTADVTEELLESAGLSLSGGPFLYMAIAMFDHLVLTTYLTTFTGVSSILHRLKSKMDARTDMSHPPLARHQHNNNMATTRLHSESSSDAKIMMQQHHHLYSVAWNAATEYFTSISTKLETQQRQQQQQQQQQHSNIRNYPSNNTRCSKYNTTRSKSTGNLQTLASSDDDDIPTSSSHSRALFRDLVAVANNKGGFDATILPSDAQIVLFSYLPPKDILSFACTNRAARSLLDDGVVVDKVAAAVSTTSSSSVVAKDEEASSCGGRRRPPSKNGSDTPLLIWKALFHRDYSWVLMDWDVGKDAFQRSTTAAFVQQQQQHDGRPRDPNSRKVFRHLMSSIRTDSEHSATTTTTSWPVLEEESTKSSDAFSASVPVASMKEFYFTFAEAWLNYIIAGCNSPADRCLIGLHGHVFDITNFVEDHPGSTETLLLQAGRDATVFFESMWHSLGARKLALGMCAVVNGQCVRWDCIPPGGGGDGDLFPRNAAGRPGSNFSPWGLAKPTHASLTARRNMLGFLIPRRRSSPRFQGGLHRIRERLRQEEEIELNRAAQWGLTVLGTDGMFGGVHVYFDPFCGWRWWYTDRDFNAVFVTPPRPTS